VAVASSAGIMEIASAHRIVVIVGGGGRRACARTAPLGAACAVASDRSRSGSRSIRRNRGRSIYGRLESIVGQEERWWNGSKSIGSAVLRGC